MVLFARLLRPGPAVLAFLLIHSTSAMYKHSTHRTHYVGSGRGLKLESYHPESIFHAFGVDGVDPLPEDRRYARSTLDTGDVAVSFLASKLSISEDSVHHHTTAQGQVTNHAFLAQKINGVPVANAVANVAFNNNGNVTSFSSSFVEHSGAADINPSVTLRDAIATAEWVLDGTYNGHPTKLQFLVQPDGFAALTYAIQIRNDTARTCYEAFVDAHSNTLLSVTDFIARSSYYVVPFRAQDPTITQTFATVTDPQDLNSSTLGWHTEFINATNQTEGNNVVSFYGLQLINITVQSSADLNFNYVADLTQDPSTDTNRAAAIVNAFYVVNMFHDFAYFYGFNEATFNHQTNNMNKTGEGFDRVLVSVQDTRGKDGADFLILPDGQSSEMQLYLWNDFTPPRDSALQNDILIHESQHGVNNRMTGGGTAACYQTNEAKGLDEGYADAVADALSQNDVQVDYIFGSGVSTGTTGLRTYPYSTSATTNPLRYSSLKGMTSFYAMGEVWANILHVVYAALVDSSDWTWNILEDVPHQDGGNVVYFHLLFDALLLQPCNPTFVQARDAFILAAKNRYNATDDCLLWDAFASRGLGVNAANFVDDTSVPTGC